MTTLPARQTTGTSLTDMLKAALPELRTLAPKYVKHERLIQLAIDAKMRQPLLAQCSPESVLNFCKRCAEAGTDRVGSGGMWAVPFWSTKQNRYEMVPIPDWRLLIEKAKKAKAIKHATAEVVRVNDIFDYERGMEPKLLHKPAINNRGDIVAVYCIYTLPDDTRDFLVMNWKDDVVPIRNRSKAWQSFEKDKRECPWNTDPEEMGKKTVVKRTMKLFEGATPELTSLIEADNVVMGYTDAAVEPRIPISEPREIGAAPPENVSPEPTKAQEPVPTEDDQRPESAPQPPSQDNAPPQDDGMTYGIVQDVGIMHSKPDAKKEWTKWSVNVGGKWYSTFDEEFGSKANSLKGKQVGIRFEEDGKYKNLTAIDEVLEPAPLEKKGGNSGFFDAPKEDKLI